MPPEIEFPEPDNYKVVSLVYIALILFKQLRAAKKLLFLLF